MPSLEVCEFAKKLNILSFEDKQCLLKKLLEEISQSGLLKVENISNNDKKTFNINPDVKGSGYNNTAINHDQVLVNNI